MNLRRLIVWGLATAAYLAVLAADRGGAAAVSASYVSYIVSPLLAAAATFATRAHAGRPAAPRAWTLLSGAGVAWAAASAAWMLAPRYGLMASVSDVMYVVYGLLLLAGAMAFPLDPAPLRGRALVILDVVAVALAVTVAQWAWISPFYLTAEQGGRLATTVWLTLNALVLAVLLVKAPRRPPGTRLTWLLLTTAAGVLATADAIYHLQLLSGRNITGGIEDGLWAVGFLLFGAAAYNRQRSHAGTGAPHTSFAIAGDVMVYATLFTAGAAIVWRAANGGVTTTLVVMAAGLTVVSVIRQIAMAADHDRLTRRLLDAAAERADLLESYETSLRIGRMCAWEWRAATDALRWSPHAEQILGRVPEHYEQWRALVHPDDRQLLRQRIVQAREDDRVEEVELRIVRPDGAQRWVAATAAVVRDDTQRPVAMVGNLLDITDRKASELELQKTTALLEHVMTSSPIHTFAGSVRRGIKMPHYVSENIVRLLGGSLEDYYLPGEAWEALVHPDDLETAREANRRALADGYAEYEARMRHANGDYLWFRTVLRIIPAEEGDSSTYVGCMIDVTAFRSTEDQLRQAQKMEAVGQLAGGFAHDFNNLLTAIGGYAEQTQLYAQAGTPAEAALSEVLKATRQAAVLIEQLMTFSRGQDVRPAEVDVRDAISGMTAILRSSVGEAVSLRVLQGPPGRIVKLPPGQLEQMLLNLVVNARDAMPFGGVVTIAVRDIELGTHEAEQRRLPRGPYLELTVADTGTGMSAETLSRVFEPFFTTKAPGSGTGLGLPMVYGIVTQAGGIVSLDSAPGRGTTVTVLLPLAPGQSLYDATPMDRERTPGLGSGQPCTILLVEDQAQVRALVAATLERQGHSIIAVEDGLAALAALETLAEPIDLIITDVVMPTMSGIELVARLEGSHPNVPVLFMSGYADAASGSISDAHGFLRKPFSIAELTREVALRLPSAAGEMSGS